MFDQNNNIYFIIISLLTLKITGKMVIIIMYKIIIIKIYYRMFGKFDQMVWKTRNNQNNKIFGLTLSNTNNTCTVSGNVNFRRQLN